MNRAKFALATLMKIKCKINTNNIVPIGVTLIQLKLYMRRSKSMIAKTKINGDSESMITKNKHPC